MLVGGHFADLRLPAVAAQAFPSEPDAAAPENRQAAANIKLGLDLEAHSAASLTFLHEVHQHPRLANPGFLATAVSRYERLWLPLLAAHAGEQNGFFGGKRDGSGGDGSIIAVDGGHVGAVDASGTAAGSSFDSSSSSHGLNGLGDGGVPAAGSGRHGSGGSGNAAHQGPLAAPLDVAWVWMGHAIAPAAYRKDVEAVLGSEAASRLWTGRNAAASAPHTRPAAALAATQALWEAAYPGEPFHLPGLEPPCSNAAAAPPKQAAASGGAATTSSGGARTIAAECGGTGGGSSKAIACTYDIAAAGVRQFDFYWSTSLPHYREAWCIARAVSRYRRFLHLHRLNPGRFIVPPYDVDLIWHTHMACSPHYYADCDALFGSVFAHDDSVNDRTPGRKLDTNWRSTQELYWRTFGEPLAADGAMWRGPPPPAWAAGPPLTATTPAPQQQPRIYVLTAADTGAPLAPIGSWDAVLHAGVAMAVRATPVGGMPADERILLLQHWGPASRAAIVQVLTLDGRLEATARMVGRESLPTDGPHVAPSTPALHWSDRSKNGKGAAGLDTLERAFCIMSPRGDWGVSIARWSPEAQASRAVPLEVDLYRLSPAGGATQAVWRAEEQHTKAGLRLHFGPPSAKQPKATAAAAADVLGSNCGIRSGGTGAAPGDSASAHGEAMSAHAANGAAAAAGNSAGNAGSTSATAPQLQQSSMLADSPGSSGEAAPRRASGFAKLRHAVTGWTPWGSHSRGASRAHDGGRGQGDEAARGRAVAAACDAAAAAFADFGPDSRGIAVALGGPVANAPASTALQPASDGAQKGSAAAAANGGAAATEHGAPNGMTPAVVTADAAASAARLAGGATPAAVAVGPGESAAEALAFAGALALQAMMLGCRDADTHHLFRQGLFAASGLGPPQDCGVHGHTQNRAPA